jgi:hypothetical protein
MSSVYSQPSPELLHDHHSAAVGKPGFDISPPSSPEPDVHQQQDSDLPRRFRSMRDVSPVDENRGRLNPSPRTASHIPVLRKAPPSLRNEGDPIPQKFWEGKVEPNSKVRWDEYSGEPASGNTGRPGQVSPGTYAREALAPPSRRPMGNHVSVSGPESNARLHMTLAERANRYGKKPPPVDTRPLEPWSRATGRAEIAKPFKDQPSNEPLRLPRKSEAGRAAGLGKDASNSLTTTLGRDPRADTEPVANTDAGFSMHEEPIKPIVPLKVIGTSPPRGIASPISPHNPANPNPYSYPSPITPTNKQPLTASNSGNRGARPEPAQPEPATPKAKAAKGSVNSTPGSTASKDNGLSSRFSWTTYNTSTTYQHSPPPSPPPSLPTSKVPASAATSILNRKRPISTADKIPARKPVATASPGHATIMSSGPPSPRPDSTYSTSTHKALPRPPTELTAVDHVQVLESQMEDLRIQRNNVFRVLNDLNSKIPSNPMITDFKRMRLVEQRKKDYAEQLAQIKREEHDVGLKLHRAWRKRDDQSESALWVRRVTQ